MEEQPALIIAAILQMKKLILTIVIAAGTSVFAGAENSAPHLETRHGVKQLVVDGQPFLILGGELHNSSSSSRWPDERHLHSEHA